MQDRKLTDATSRFAHTQLKGVASPKKFEAIWEYQVLSAQRTIKILRTQYVVFRYTKNTFYPNLGAAVQAGD